MWSAFRRAWKAIRDALGRREVAVTASLVPLFLLWGPVGGVPFDWRALGLVGSDYGAAVLDHLWVGILGIGVPLGLVALRRERLAAYGLGLGDVRLGAWVVGVGLLVGGLATTLGGDDPALRASHPPFDVPPGGLPAPDFVLYAAAAGVFFLATEVTMRGWLLFGLEPVSPALAVAVTTLVQTLWHLGAPLSELLIAPVWGIVIGVLNLRLRSIWPGFLVHWLPNLWLDAQNVYELGRAGFI